MIVRFENEKDIEDISIVTKAAFDTLEISGHTEQFIIHALRKAGALAISLVAETDGRIVGHIALSPVTISDGSTGWYGLGPISVLPELHRQGIGKSLMKEGLSLLKEIGGKGCVLVGDPAYYERFGFRSFSSLTVDGVPQQYVLALPLEGDCPSGTAVFPEAFMAKS